MAKITKIETTNDKISGRGGITFFLHFVEQIGFFSLFPALLTLKTTSSKGLSLYQFIKQMLAFFIDGTNMSISHFDTRKKDSGYAAVLENSLDQMASSHQIKRFFCKLSFIGNGIYRKVLRELFIWRLRIEQPEIINLGIDTMVLNNDDAKKREGCEPTYKKKKGFQPLHICWGSYLIDVIFRKGSAHSNHGTDFIDSVSEIVELIRKRYRADVPIMLMGDTGFCDQKAFDYFEQVLKILYVVTGKKYEETKSYLQGIDIKQFKKYNGNGIWSYFEFGNKLKSWKRFRRCIFTTLDTDEDGQFVLEFAKSDNIIYTNIGIDKELTDQLVRAGGEEYLSAEGIIELNHQRGADELIP